MNKENLSQLELFAQGKEQGEAKQQISSSLLSRIWNYEKTILLIIGFSIVGIAGFCIGVEKGKRMASLPASAVKVKELPSTAIKLKQAPQAVKDNVIIKQQMDIDEGPDEGYTIQVASYKTRKFAEKEAGLLKKKGYRVWVVPKGKYTVVCVGNFNNKGSAQSLLSEMKKRYGVCLIRRL